MKILANSQIKGLFEQALLAVGVFLFFSLLVIGLGIPGAAGCVAGLGLAMALGILAAGLRYFQEQNRTLEQAAAQVRKYLDGEQAARIDCEEEGELYRLFHEVNSLAAVLNAHVQREKSAKLFLKDTISDISHQLKTPLAALNIYNGILQEETREQPALREFTQLSEQELERMENLVQNLLKIAKLDAGTMPMERRKENLAELMEEVEGHFAWRAAKEGKVLRFLGEDLLWLSCDRTWLMEAVSNLVKNALEHTKAGEEITVSWCRLALDVQLTVEDSGRGIHPEDLYYIFKRFYRSRFSSDTRGIGLGLPLAKAIIEKHGGTIEVESEWGEGTTFTVFLRNPTEL